uniref:F-box domain-containing protein n=1 Tax=Culex tarsalis TaxID=7177 RepID=A0A1Q3EVX1_CULTA
MDQTTANALLSPSRTPGLQWLCPECHQTQTFTALQRTDIRYGADLPPELWIAIFRNLDKRSLLHVRAACHRWKNIVDQNQPLRKRFCVKFVGPVTVDDRYRPESLLPAPCAEFCRAKIISVVSWWPSFGAGLTELNFDICDIALPVLLAMLKETPNLACLTLGHVESATDEELNADFRLEKLECLYCQQIFDVFGSVFTRLRELNLESQLDDIEATIVCRFFRSVQGTLKDLDCQLIPLMLEQMASMDRLRLTKVAVRLAGGDLAVQLSQIQSSIESLNVIAFNEDLSQVGRNLTKLKEITVILLDSGFVVPSFLAEMRQLKVLRLEGFAEDVLNLNPFKSATLTHLKLERFNIDGLQAFLTNCPNLQDLELCDCLLNSWLEIFAAQFKTLRRLTIYSTKVMLNAMNVPNVLECLEELNITTCNICAEMIVELLRQCPRLAKLTLRGLDTINDEFVGVLGRFPQLKELHIYYCEITDKSLQLIAENYYHLIVKISSQKISDAAIKLLSYATRSG